MGIFVTIITVTFFAHWTIDMQFNKHGVVLLHGRELWEYRSLTSSHYFFNAFSNF